MHDVQKWTQKDCEEWKRDMKESGMIDEVFPAPARTEENWEGEQRVQNEFMNARVCKPPTSINRDEHGYKIIRNWERVNHI